MDDNFERIAEFVRAFAERTSSRTESNLQRIAAYCFAVATLLAKRFWDASWDEEWDFPKLDLRASLEALGQQTHQIVPRELYRSLISTLVAIEDALAGNANMQRWLLRPSAMTILLDDEDGCQVGLTGEVSLWLRPRSLARYAWERAHRALDEFPHPPVRPQPPAVRLERLALHWQEPQLPRVYPVRRSRPIEVFDDVWHSRGDRQFPLKIALCPLVPGAGPWFDIDKDGREFTACRPELEGLRNREVLEEHLRMLFMEGANAGVHLYVLPELSIDNPARQYIAEQIRQYPGDLLGIISGSFHMWQDPDPKRPVNEAVLLDSSGEIAWRHEKRGHFAVPRNKIGQFKPFFRHKPPQLPWSQVTEGIRRGDLLNVLDTRIGRLCLLICSDITDPDCDYREVVRRIRPDILFIVSLSPETERFEAFAREIKDLAISTLFVNAACACGVGTDLALVDLAFWAEESTPPTQVRWQAGGDLICYDFAEHGWRKVGPDEGVGLLPSGQVLVIDLGAFYRRWLRGLDR